MESLMTSPNLVSEKHYKELFEQIPAPIAMFMGKDLRYVFINPAYSRIINYRDVLGKTLIEAFPELAGQPFLNLLEKVYQTGISYNGNDIPVIYDSTNEGILSTRYFNLVYTAYKNTQGVIEGVMAFGQDVTEQVELRTKEKESEVRFRNIVEQSIDPILILKGEHLVLDVANEPLLNLWHIDKNAFGKPFLEILPEMKEQGFFDLLMDVYHNGITHHGNETPVYFWRANGKRELLYFNFIYQPYRESNGDISGVLILATDVSEQVKARKGLIESENNFRNMILQSPVAMCVLRGINHIVEIANDRMLELWGKSSSEMKTKPIFEGLPEVRGTGFEEILKKVLITGERYAQNERPVTLLRKGQVETIFINFVYEALKEGDGSISGIIAVAIEVTEQVLARKKIEFAEENARLAIESGDLGSYEINLLTNEMVTSLRFVEIWGIDQTINRSHYEAMLHPDDLILREKAHEESIVSGNLAYEARIIWKDQTIHWVRIRGKVLYDDAEKAIRLIGVIQDVTEQKQFASQLEKKVEQRTKALQEANENLAKSNAELEQFAYVTSHDLQEPLRKIQVFNDILLDRYDLKDDAKKYVAKVAESAKRMSGLIRDLLDYSRLAQTSTRFEEVDLNKILLDVIADFELFITQKKATIKSETLINIEAVPLQMNQLFYNLIGNALKFSKKDVPPVINIETRKLSSDQFIKYPSLDPNISYCQVIFHDNGVGFDQEYAEKIFTIFQRLNERSLYGGYGIGLALCRKIVDNHNGIIYAEGKVKKGATFTVILPCRQD